MIRTNQLKL